MRRCAWTELVGEARLERTPLARLRRSDHLNYSPVACERYWQVAAGMQPESADRARSMLKTYQYFGRLGITREKWILCFGGWRVFARPHARMCGSTNGLSARGIGYLVTCKKARKRPPTAPSLLRLAPLRSPVDPLQNSRGRASEGTLDDTPHRLLAPPGRRSQRHFLPPRIAVSSHRRCAPARTPRNLTVRAHNLHYV